MILKSIELSGFKSFAKRSVLEFNSTISAIVGPNGSGKSNVAEAFRFVLGEQSIKSLRGKRGEDLIFNGGGGEARGNRAAVKVVFDNTSRFFDIDFPEVSIERTVHRDGVNDYFINGSQVRLKDILELLAHAHIGASGHQIISQGEADKILSASTRDRKSIIEDALGLKIYQYKRVESDRKLKKTFENIVQVESLRREIAPHLRFLQKQVEKVEKAESMKKELIELGLEYFAHEEFYVQSKMAEITQRKGPLEELKSRQDNELLKAKETLERVSLEKNKEYEVLGLEKDIAFIRKEKDVLSRELGKIEGSLSAESRLLLRHKEAEVSEDNKMVRLKEVVRMSEYLNEDLRGFENLDIENLKALLTKVRERISAFIISFKESDSSEISELETSIRDLNQEKETIEKNILKSEESESALIKKYNELRKEIETEKDSGHDAEKAVFRIMAEQNDNLSKLAQISAEEDRLNLIRQSLKREEEEVAQMVGAEVLHFKLPEENVERQAQEEKKRHIEKLKIRLEDAGLSGGEEIMKEHRETSERDEFLAKELQDLENGAESLKTLIAELEERLTHEFETGLEKINKNFGELFSQMFGGGEAHLTLTKDKKKKADALLEGEDIDDTDDSDEVEEVGLDISVSLPRKKIRGLMMLSGGERALTSIALLFAISQVNPPPFIILDETDAALDEANSKKYGDMVEKLSEHSQLILITHNRETMSRAGIIYGVTMSSTGVSKLLSIEFDQAVQIAK